MRIELHSRKPEYDSPARSAAALVARVSGHESAALSADVFVVNRRDDESTEKPADGDPIPVEAVRRIFLDPVAQSMDSPFAATTGEAWDWLVEIVFRPGVTDTLAITAREAIAIALGREVAEGLSVRSARQYLFRFHSGAPSREEMTAWSRALYNPLIQGVTLLGAKEYAGGARPPERYPEPRVHDRAECETLPVATMDDAALEALSRSRLLALTLEEMRVVRDHFASAETKRDRVARGLPVEATDVEIEMIAQTWSEHCKHKIFAARIEYAENGERRTVDSLYKSYIKATTEAIRPFRDFLLSVFVDNAGIIKFTDDWSLCIKAETHNSPSALDPYGGAITGIVGVNRDILGSGRGARPIFNTNVLCFGYPDTPASEVPEGLLHPRTILEGVHRGIVDGGNQSGIPTVGGAFLFDDCFMGKPLVFCGTGGIMPATIGGKPSHEKKVEAGHLAVMLGGRIGKDGIHGATFSSLGLDESSPDSAVQIGDPIIQRKMTDFLLEARDLELYEGITDNGAGGLSSSLGEMADGSGGIRIDLDACPLKYHGLSPWEILVSESQERMSLSVLPARWPEFLALARKRDVEATVVGEFTSDGYIDIRANGKPAGLLPISFLHHGLPQMRLAAVWDEPKPDAGTVPEIADWNATLLTLLAEPNVASKERLIRRYDHEVQGGSIEKPFTGIERDAPSDGAVIKPLYDQWRGVTVTHGICPRYGKDDAYRMAQNAVDEAMRAHIALGGDPERAVALDNFCWPDPVQSASTPDGERKLGQLVRACAGLKDACIAYGLPLVSGKDSMKNDATAGGRKISVKPTLLVTLMGFIDDVRKATSTDFLRAGDLVYVVGDTNGELGGSMLASVLGIDGGEAPAVDPRAAMKLYAALHKAISGKLARSVHDVSDGGIACAVAESCIGGRLGARIELGAIPGDHKTKQGSEARALFGEGPSRFVVSVHPSERERFEETLAGFPVKLVGETLQEPRLAIACGGKTLVDARLDEVVAAFKRCPA